MAPHPSRYEVGCCHLFLLGEGRAWRQAPAWQNAAMAEEMTEVSRNLATEARELAEMVGRFEVSREAARDWRMAG